jgi:hypothetical protein
MKKKNDEVFSLEVLSFLIRKPWFFIYPFVVITVMTFVYVTHIPKTYYCSAAISVRDIRGDIPWRVPMDISNLTARVLLGENMDWMAGAIWPDISEEKDPIGYAARVNALKRGIKFGFPRNIPGLIRISFRSGKPDLTYKVVQATIDIIRMESSRTIEESINTSVEFIKKQMELYQERLAAINAEMVSAAAKLREMAMGLNVEQRELIHRITGESVLRQRWDEVAVMGEARSTDILSDLEMNLVTSTRKKQLLESRLEREDFEIVRSESRATQEDVFAKAIEKKKMEIFELSSRGYLPAHPIVAKHQSDLDHLERMREQHAEELLSEKQRELSESEKKLAAHVMREEVEELEFVIGTLEAQIEVMKEYREEISEIPAMEEALIAPVANEATRMKGLRDEREIILRYYNDLKKELEKMDLRSRAEDSRALFLVHVIEPPKVPIKPLSSKKANVLFLGFMMAVGAGLGLSFLVDMLDNSICSASEFRDKFHLPVLAAVVKIYTPRDILDLRARKHRMIILLFAAVLAGAIVMKIASKVLMS